MLICGDQGLGQNYICSAILHHLEGFHVQTLDLGTLVSDSTRTPEAACVDLFNEAKRHKPSVICIPSLLTWSNSVNEIVISTIKGLLNSLEPSDPILVLGILEGKFEELPTSIKSWFGFVKSNRFVLEKPGPSQREEFFEELIEHVRKKPNEFPDGVERRKRVLEVLEKAPPPPPRVPTAAELEQQKVNDHRLREYLKFRLGPVLNELKKRYKKFMKPVAVRLSFLTCAHPNDAVDSRTKTTL
jgi:ATPase family AAA domain-containing protein 2